MVIHRTLKKGLLLVAFFGLLYLGAGLLEGFFPYEWRHAIDKRVEWIFPRRVYAPHPDMDLEFEMDFRQHPSHRLIEFAVLAVLVVGDWYLVLKIWQAIRKSSMEQ